MDHYLRKHSQIYRKRHFLKEKMDKELKNRTNLKNAFGRKNTFNTKDLHKMTVKNIRKNIVNKDKTRYHGSSKLKKDELIQLIVNKQVTKNNRKGDFNYRDLLKEMDDTVLKLKSHKIKLYLDICAAPGDYSDYLSETLKCKGVGVTLPVKNGGMEFKYDLKNYKLEYLDVIKEYKKPFSSEKFDFIISGCLDMTRIKKKPFYDINLWLSTMLLAFLNLKPGGIFAFKISLKYINFSANIIYLFEQFFKTVKVFKSTTAIPFRSMFYVIGLNFKHNKVYFPLLEEIYTNYNHKSDDSDIKDLKFKLMFEDAYIMQKYMKLFENVFKVQIQAIQDVL
jgi:23S rRNA U2552 (ribose-2'-O)-methylase RlmE/FtsJ